MSQIFLPIRSFHLFVDFFQNDQILTHLVVLAVLLYAPVPSAFPSLVPVFASSFITDCAVLHDSTDPMEIHRPRRSRSADSSPAIRSPNHTVRPASPTDSSFSDSDVDVLSPLIVFRTSHPFCQWRLSLKPADKTLVT